MTTSVQTAVVLQEQRHLTMMIFKVNIFTAIPCCPHSDCPLCPKSDCPDCPDSDCPDCPDCHDDLPFLKVGDPMQDEN
jgi:hypothetical protein